MYPNWEHEIFINLNTSKKLWFKIMIYHLKGNLAIEKYPAKKAVELILFLNQLFNLAKT